jgi:hypothetical protein
MDNGWCVDYAVVEDDEEDELDELDEDEPTTVSTYIVTKIED